MNDLIKKLLDDMRWRLSRAGKEYKPKLKERVSWGVFRFPPFASFLIWCGLLPLAIMLGMQDVPNDLEPIVGLLGVTLVTLLMTQGVHLFNKHMIMSTYRKLLKRNERFALVEYAKYIKRQIKRAQNDPVLGGPVEVQRLKKVYIKLNEVLQKGAGDEIFKVESQLSKEADLAEAVVESYDLPAYDELSDLDQKLPEDVRLRVAELEMELLDPALRQKELDES